MVEKISGIIKFTVAVIILPVVVAITMSLYSNALLLPINIITGFLWGLIIYLILHLFIVEPTIVYEKGHSIVGFTFKFLSPIIDVLAVCIPIYAVIVLVVYYSFSLFYDVSAYLPFFAFLMGFTLLLHLVNSARTLNLQSLDVLRASYFLYFELIYVLNVIICAAMLWCLSHGFLLGEFFANTLKISWDIYFAAVKQLFFNT